MGCIHQQLCNHLGRYRPMSHQTLMCLLHMQSSRSQCNSDQSIHFRRYRLYCHNLLFLQQSVLQLPFLLRSPCILGSILCHSHSGKASRLAELRCSMLVVCTLDRYHCVHLGHQTSQSVAIHQHR